MLLGNSFDRMAKLAVENAELPTAMIERTRRLNKM